MALQDVYCMMHTDVLLDVQSHNEAAQRFQTHNVTGADMADIALYQHAC